MKYYLKTHEWVEDMGTSYQMGISKYASDQLGDVVFVEAKSVGEEFDAGESLAILESVKAVGDIYAPFDCKITKVNKEVIDSPEKINESQDWVVEIEAKGKVTLANVNDIMDEEDYESQYLALL